MKKQVITTLIIAGVIIGCVGILADNNTITFGQFVMQKAACGAWLALCLFAGRECSRRGWIVEDDDNDNW